MTVCRFFATTVQGLEDVAAHEISSLVQASSIRPEAGRGRVFFEAPPEAMYELNLRARVLHKVFLLLLRERFEGLSGIYRAAKSGSVDAR